MVLSSILALASTAFAADPVADSKKDLEAAKAAIAKKAPGQALAPCRRALERQPTITDKALAVEVATVCTLDVYAAQLEVSIAELEAERAKKKTGALAGCRDGSPKQARIKLKELPKLDAAAKTLIDSYSKLCP